MEEIRAAETRVSIKWHKWGKLETLFSRFLFPGELSERS